MFPVAVANPVESTSFWRDALAWRGAITPKLLPRIGLFAAYAGAVAFAHATLAWEGPDPIHLGYTGGLLAVLLVLRTNAAYDRWWEARKMWGGIVNQSRNLAVKALEENGFAKVKRTMLPGVGHSALVREVWEYVDEIRGD